MERSHKKWQADFSGILAASQSLEDGLGKQVCEVASLVGLVLAEVSDYVGLGSC